MTHRRAAITAMVQHTIAEWVWVRMREQRHGRIVMTLSSDALLIARTRRRRPFLS